MTKNTNFKTVKRNAKVGERILITDAFSPLGTYCNGDIFTVNEEFPREVRVFEHTTLIFHYEYEVIIENETEADGMNNIKSLKEIVESLKSCSFECEAGPLINNVDFQLLERIAGIGKGESVESLSKRIASTNPFYKTPKSPQQIRDEIIEKAKRDVVELERVMKSIARPSFKGNTAFNEYVTYVKFFVNKEKRVVTVLVYDVHDGELLAKGIAKCAPNDCFNVHIGRAIALRRALGLEVPAEYLNAPQPTEVRVGDVIRRNNSLGNPYEREIESIEFEKIVYKNGGFDYANAIYDCKVIDDSREEAIDCY
ncbi:hypothetical protein HYI36_20290 [Bacillus sp. Gen3]|nr:hypothetical protein [Bacillus sp. Gen3]